MSATVSVAFLLLMRLLLIRGRGRRNNFCLEPMLQTTAFYLIPTSPREEKSKNRKGNCTSFSATFSQDRLVPIPDVGHACFSTAFSHLPVYLSPASKSFTTFLSRRRWSFTLISKACQQSYLPAQPRSQLSHLPTSVCLPQLFFTFLLGVQAPWVAWSLPTF